MAFVKNTYQQLTFYDRVRDLDERERRIFDKSWAKQFGDKIFPLIDESRFAVLYSDKASRPNTPVNCVVGGILLERLLDMTDEEMIETLIFDVRYQYALQTHTCMVQPFSTNTFRRFRVRNDKYKEETGRDLLEEYMKELEQLVREDPVLRVLIRRSERNGNTEK
ncbi:MAG: transposase [Eubacteriales bacterium]|nr:transposase [Eubacteriales bacterium]